MKTLIFIILKIAEILGFFSLMLFVLILISFFPKIYDFIENGITLNLLILIWVFILSFGLISVKKDFKRWISKNKEWSEKIYNKLKR